VVLSGGAFNTPALLQHSGIGPADFLRSVGVQPVLDLPAVGENLMEHPLVYVTHELKSGQIGMFDADHPKQLLNLLLRRRGKLTSNFAECAAHIRTDPTMPAPNFQVIFAAGFFFDHGLMKWDAPAATIGLSYLAPRSRGAVRIRSADPTRKPGVTYNLLSSESEMAEMTDAVLFAREIAAAGPARTLLAAEITPGPGVRSRLEIADWIRASCQHCYHPASSARIGAPDDGVVDPQLRVHGIEGLRIADCSVMPTVTRGNTHAPAVMIGERCAAFIRQPAAAPLPAPTATVVSAR
jgi:choline dehydrogenase